MKMSNISKYQGVSQFGPAYRVMFENDMHAAGSIDRILTQDMIRLCLETADYLYKEYTPTRSFYKRGLRPELEQYVNPVRRGGALNPITGQATGLSNRVKKVILDNPSKEEQIEAITQFTSSLQKKASDDLDLMQFGGIEEEIIARGSDWCTDVARVGCTLCQVAGFPARIVHLVDIEKAYKGHVIIEVYRAEIWGAVDPLTNIIYRHSGGKPLSTWDLMNNPRLAERHWKNESTPHTTANQFRGAAISNYFVWRWKEYDYTISKVNDYYRSILEMAHQGWPGGLRWIHKEDK